MRLAYSLNAYTRVPLEEAIASAASIGYEAVELLADVPHAWPAGLLPQDVEKIRSLLDRHGLVISNVNAFMMRGVGDVRNPYWHPSWIEPDEYYRAIRREHTKRVLQLAHALGAPNIQTEPGGPLPEGWTYKKAIDVFYEELMPCVELAEKLQVYLLIEPEPGLLIERMEQFLELAARVDSPWLGLNFDLGHAFCVRQDPQDWVERMSPFTRHYHIEDIAADRRHVHLIPGEGAMDFHAILAAIARTAYSGFLTVELYPYEENPEQAGRKAKAFLDRILGELEQKY